MEAKHTPGPWEAKGLGRYPNGKRSSQPYIYAPTAEEGTRHVAELYISSPDANAHLIAAAPELLEALEDAQQALAHALHRLKDDGSFSTSIALKGAEEKARIAITKAKGGN